MACVRQQDKHVIFQKDEIFKEGLKRIGLHTVPLVLDPIAQSLQFPPSFQPVLKSNTAGKIC